MTSHERNIPQTHRLQKHITRILQVTISGWDTVEIELLDGQHVAAEDKRGDGGWGVDFIGYYMKSALYSVVGNTETISARDGFPIPLLRHVLLQDRESNVPL